MSPYDIDILKAIVNASIWSGVSDIAGKIEGYAFEQDERPEYYIEVPSFQEAQIQKLIDRMEFLETLTNRSVQVIRPEENQTPPIFNNHISETVRELVREYGVWIKRELYDFEHGSDDFKFVAGHELEEIEEHMGVEDAKELLPMIDYLTECRFVIYGDQRTMPVNED